MISKEQPKSAYDIPCIARELKSGEISFRDDFESFKIKFKELIKTYSLLIVYRRARPYYKGIFYRITPIEDNEDKINFCANCYYSECFGTPIGTGMQFTKMAVIDKNDDVEAAWDSFEAQLLKKEMANTRVGA